MLKKIIGRLLRKHGMVGLLILIGDVAVKQTKSKTDDEIWAKVKELLETF
jgi:hypothetical protein|tara:strand:+ start:1644 stop:1793 length:150 start_codon:yes stop_codon:yes gene_type:complete